MFGRCVLRIREKENTACHLSAGVLALQRMRAGLSRGRGNPVKDPAADDGVLQIVLFIVIN